MTLSQRIRRKQRKQIDELRANLAKWQDEYRKALDLCARHPNVETLITDAGEAAEMVHKYNRLIDQAELRLIERS